MQEHAFVLRAAPSAIQLKPAPAGAKGKAAATRVTCFNDVIPGPLLRVRQGERLAIMVENRLDAPLSLHWHGAGAPNALDGVAGLTGPAIAPGETRALAFTPSQAGLFWYRPMAIGSVGRQTESGLYGVLIVDELAPPVVDHDILLVLDDWALDDANQLSPLEDDVASRAGAGRLGNWLTQNSKPLPGNLAAQPGAPLRLRLLNACNARAIPLEFSGLDARVIAVDGRPSEVFRPANDSLTLAPGGRYDTLVSVPAGKGSVSATLGNGMPLLVIEGEEGQAMRARAHSSRAQPSGEPPRTGRLPETLAAPILLQNAVRARLKLAGGVAPGQGVAAAGLKDATRIWTINGRAWPDAQDKPLFTVHAGQPVSLELENATGWMQALHIHGHHVRRLHRLDDGWEPYWLDVIAIPAAGTARIAFNAGAPGKWLIGSAVAERLDGGMAAWFEVAP